MTDEPIRVAPRTRGAHRTITDALNAAPTGAVISIAPGAYAESFRLVRRVTLRPHHGEGSVTIAVPAAAGALTVAAPDCRLLGLVLRGADPAEAVLRVEDAAGLTLEDCTVTHGRIEVLGSRNPAAPHDVPVGDIPLDDDLSAELADPTAGGVLVVRRSRLRTARHTALHLTGDSLARLEDTAIAGVEGIGVAVSGSAVFRADLLRVHGGSGSALRARDSSRILLRGSVLRGAGRNGVLVQDAAEALLTDCRVENAARSGVRLDHTARAEIGESTLADARLSGIEVRDQSRIMMREVRVTGGETGARLRSTEEALLLYCSFLGQKGNGIELTPGADPRLRGVRVAQSGKHGVLVGEAARGTFDHCDVIATAFPALHVARDAAPRFRGCRVFNTAQDLGVAEGARPSFENCVAVNVATSRLPGPGDRGHHTPATPRGPGTQPRPGATTAAPRPAAPAAEPGAGPEAGGAAEAGAGSEPAAGPESLPDLLAELDELVGLDRRQAGRRRAWSS